MSKLHCICCSSLGNGTKVCSITKHLCQRHLCFYNLGCSPELHTFNPSSTSIKITNNITHVFFRYNYLYFHHWLQNNRIGFFSTFSKGHRASYFKCHFR